MKAIILASGVGRRLRPLTKKRPKCLIKLNGISIIDRIISSLISNGISEVVITTGYFGEKIKEFIRKKYKHIMNVTYIENPIYYKTNYIYSLWLTRKIPRDSDIILLHSDLVYDFDLMRRIIKEKKSCVLVKKKGELPQKDFKARINQGLVVEIGVNLFGTDAKFCIPFYKFLKKDFEDLLNEIEKFIKNKKVDCYAEDALNKILNKIKLYPVYFENELCMEIDDFNDLKLARNFFKNILTETPQELRKKKPQLFEL